MVGDLSVLLHRATGVGACQCHLPSLPHLPPDQSQRDSPPGKVRLQTLRRRPSLPRTHQEDAQADSIPLVDYRGIIVKVAGGGGSMFVDKQNVIGLLGHNFVDRNYVIGSFGP